MYNSVKTYKQIKPIPIYIRISPLKIHRIYLNNPFSETQSFREYEYPLRLLIQKIFTNNTFLVEISVLTNYAKFEDIFKFTVMCINDYAMLCLESDALEVSITETTVLFQISLQNKCIFKSKFY
ncbi:hypothetical protein CDIK_0111 [Cucumispora dikerogammari]|nr:hypothetical protein CDIK_0111 [Cucumispora dikerogammari]